MVGNGDVHNASTLMGEDQEYEQESTRCGRHDEEVGCRDLMDVIRQERAPGLRRRSDAPEHVLRDSRLRGVEAYGPPRPEETKSDTHGRPERL